MSIHSTRKPSAASESFITALAALFFIAVALLFLWLDDRKSNTGNSQLNEQPEHSELRSNAPEKEGRKNEMAFSNEYGSENLRRTKNAEAPETSAQQQVAGIIQHFSPPILRLDIPPQLFSVNAATGRILVSKHNSVITIPPNAFLDKHGNTVSGDVIVKYREFYNYLDFFLSGIPMEYDSGGSTQQLESAGMMELTASKGNEPLYVNRKSKINVMMATMNNSSDFNLYYFDKNQNKWICKGQDKLTTSAQGNPGWEFSADKKDSSKKIFSYNPKKYEVTFTGMMKPAPERKFFLARKQPPLKFTFRFDCSQNTIPELNLLRSFTWKYTGSDAAAIYQRLFGYGGDWNYGDGLLRWKNLTLQHMKADDTYLLTLYENADSMSITTIPRLGNENSIIRFNKRMAEFLDAQEQRIAMERAALKKFSDDTARYFANNPRYIQTSMTAEYYVMRQFQVDGFGIWNCDRPIRVPQPTAVFASFIDASEKPLHPIRVYLADKTQNTVYTYESKTLHRFKFNPKSQNLVWALFPGDVIAVIKPSEFREKYAQSRSVCKFRVEIKDNEVLSNEDLKEQLVFDL